MKTKTAFPHPQEEISLIVYDSSYSPKFYRFNKKLFSSFLWAVPITMGLLVAVVLILGGSARKALFQKTQEKPQEILSLELKNSQLNLSLTQAQGQVKELEKKILSGADTGVKDNLSLFQTPLGIKNLETKKLIKIENMNVLTKGDKTIVKFDILQEEQNNRVSGNIFVVESWQNQLQLFPSTARFNEKNKLLISSGESFIVSRFRPVEASFPIRQSSDKPQFHVFIFDRLGDLLFSKTISGTSI